MTSFFFRLKLLIPCSNVTKGPSLSHILPPSHFPVFSSEFVFDQNSKRHFSQESATLAHNLSLFEIKVAKKTYPYIYLPSESYHQFTVANSVNLVYCSKNLRMSLHIICLRCKFGHLHFCNDCKLFFLQIHNFRTVQISQIRYLQQLCV